MNKCFYITGTDTNIGKTTISYNILKYATNIGYNTLGYKPIASGCKLNSNGIYNYDLLKLNINSNINLYKKKINITKFIMPISPHVSNLYEMKNINLNKFSKNLKLIKKYSNIIIIEGIGGLLTPINKKFSINYWVKKENISVILIVGIRLGCINHTLLTALAVKISKLKIINWVANIIDNNINLFLINEYINILKSKLKIPLLGIIPWLKDFNMYSINKYLNNSLLFNNRVD